MRRCLLKHSLRFPSQGLSTDTQSTEVTAVAQGSAALLSLGSNREVYTLKQFMIYIKISGQKQPQRQANTLKKRHVQDFILPPV